MFLAARLHFDGGDRRVIATDLGDEEWRRLRADLRAGRCRLVLACGLPGHGKTSPLGTRYFAHNPGGDGCSAGETAAHLLAKATIVTGARSAGWYAEPEVAGHDGGTAGEGQLWVADVLASAGRHRVVFEVQWSRQCLEDYVLRTERYRRSGIGSVAWFARHAGHLPGASRELPVFELSLTEDQGLTVSIGGLDLALDDVVHRLLTRRIQHRRYASGSVTSVTQVMGQKCWHCSTWFQVWRVRSRFLLSSCGLELHDWLAHPLAPGPDRPEALEQVRQAVYQYVRQAGRRMGRLEMRTMRTTGTAYMAFVCPECALPTAERAVSRTFYLGSCLDWDIGEVVTHALGSSEHPHWCTNPSVP